MSESVEVFVLDRTVRLLQPRNGFRTSLDSVMLAAACPAADGESVLDMGCGVGGASFCLLQRLPACRITGVDLQPECVALAVDNAALNGREGQCRFVHADIRDFQAECRFDHVICNPPYLEAGHHTPSPAEGRAAALGHRDAAMDLEGWVDAGFRLLKSGGSLTIIHRADALDRLVQALGRRFGATEIIPLWPREGEAAKRVVVRTLKDRRTPLKMHAGIVLHNEDGSYTLQAETILRQGRSL